MKYLINGFKFLADALEKNMKEYCFEYVFPKPGKFDFVTNFLLLRRLIKKGKTKKFDIVHINNWENFINIPLKKERKNQIWICESHGIHIGLDTKIGVSQSKGLRKALAFFVSPILHFLVSTSIKKFDIHFVSIPNALDFAKKIRKDSKWLPNPVDINTFTATGDKTKLEGSPAIIYPTRLHDVKNPDFAFFIFSKIKKKYPKAKLHMINYPQRYTKNYLYVRQLSKFKKDIVNHHFMKSSRELASFYKGGDLVLGSFNPNSYYANLNLVELEAMACGVPVITHDAYEIVKVKLNKLPEFAISLLKNKTFRKKYTKKCLNYVKSTHSCNNVCNIIRKNLKELKNTTS